MALVFVYGSLKQGFHNHAVLHGAEFLGEARTRDMYYMVGLGGYPGVLRETNNPNQAYVLGEVYKVDDKTLARLDRLEGNGSFYNREQIHIQYIHDFHIESVWIYFLMEYSGARFIKPIDGLLYWGG